MSRLCEPSLRAALASRLLGELPLLRAALASRLLETPFRELPLLRAAFASRLFELLLMRAAFASRLFRESPLMRRDRRTYNFFATRLYCEPPLRLAFIASRLCE
jgi:hypothetical protein